MSKKSGGRLHKEDRRGNVPDIGRELQLDPQQTITPASETPEQIEASWAGRGPAKQVGPFAAILPAILLGLLVAAVIAAAIWLAFRVDVAPPISESSTPGDDQELSASELQAAIETTVRGYLDAPNDLTRSNWVVDGKNIRDTMAGFYKRPGMKPPQSFGRILDIGDAAFDGFPMHMVMAAEGDDTTGHMFSLFPVKDRMLIDWESSVGLGELSWKQFLADKPTTPVQMRVYLKRDSYYNHAFADDSRWDSYKISTRGYPDKPHGYVDASGELGRKLRAIILPNASQPVNLRLHWADEGRALLITELLHNYWVDIERLRKLSTP